jgi:hypothetical protein
MRATVVLSLDPMHIPYKPFSIVLFEGYCTVSGGTGHCLNGSTDDKLWLEPGGFKIK